MQKRISDYSINIGSLKKGPLNKITDVKGVLVGHSTIDTEHNKTGVTVILPSRENPFTHKLVCSSYTINGYGKTSGLMQVDELGQLESPIALTNTLNVGIVQDAVIDYMIDLCKRDNIRVRSINTVIAECNDSYLNDISNRAVRHSNVMEAIDSACEDFMEGDVGGGKGMSCHQLKGGIGSASRIMEFGDESYTIGVLVQSNHGLIKDFKINGNHLGRDLEPIIAPKKIKDEGSIIIVVATDLPVSSRQLKRIIKRCSVGIARLGSFIGHGSGEVVIGFSTANKMVSDELKNKATYNIKIINENHIDKAFRAVAEATEEAILNSMITAGDVLGFEGHSIKSLKNYISNGNI